MNFVPISATERVRRFGISWIQRRKAARQFVGRPFLAANEKKRRRRSPPYNYRLFHGWHLWDRL
jgi:hypothetical protein